LRLRGQGAYWRGDRERGKNEKVTLRHGHHQGDDTIAMVETPHTRPKDTNSEARGQLCPCGIDLLSDMDHS
jgi:hypothetical protein